MLSVKRSAVTSTAAALAAVALPACVPEAPTDVGGNLRPSATIDAPANGSSFGAGETVTFRGGAFDPEDGALPGASLRWTSSRDGALGAGSVVATADLSDGTHLIRLIATDSEGAADTAAISIGISVPANRPPVATITAPADGAEFAAGVAISFQGGAVDPEDGALGPSALAWESSLDGPIGTGAGFSRDDLSIGSHQIRLIATDSEGAVDTARISLGIGEPANEAPTAAFSFACTDLTCTFTDGSDDPDGTVAAWSWTFGDGGTSTEANPQHAYAGGGVYEVVLTVTDDDGATDATSRQVTVTPANQGPTAAFSFDCELLVCAFTDESSDADGTVVAWSWEFGDGQTSTARNPDHTYAAGGTYQVSLEVTDDDGATGQISRSVRANQRPTADFRFECTDLVCQFLDESTDPDGTVVAWSWNFGDGQTSSAASPQHLYAEGGTYTVTLTVTDGDGAASVPASRQVTVTPPNEPPTAGFGFVCVQLACQFTDASTDADGTIVAWSWSFGDGATSTAPNPSHVYPDGGTYAVSLEVTDDDGDTDEATVSVTVNRPPTATINAPADGSVESLGAPIQFRGAASDPDGDGLTFLWLSDREAAPLGTSLNVTEPLTRTGEHLISFIASDGIAADTAQVTIRVVQD